MNLKKKNLMCSSGGGGGPAQKQFFFGNFFQHVQKLINFGNLVKIKVAKELHFRFINSFIQPSRVGSLDDTWRLKTSWLKTKMLYVLLLQNLEGKLYSSVYKNLGHITTLMST